METAGVVIGAVALVGAFKDAIDLFALFTARREFGRDFIISLTKLDIERFLLLQWAEQVRLLHYDRDQFHDTRLNNNDIQYSVARILACIRELLCATSQLKERYGVKVTSTASFSSLISIADETPTMSGPCMERFEQQFRELKISTRSWNKTTSSLAKIRWVIEDKAKFSHLVSELSHFTTKLREIVPPTTTVTYARIAEITSTQDLERIQELSKLRIILEASTGHHGGIAGPAQDLIETKCTSRILGALWFRKMNDRRETISAAHDRTFKWILLPPDDAASPGKTTDLNNFYSWLRYDSGIYWVSGKAGSGKSTLMKFLFSCPQTIQILHDWAGSRDCTLADFFFYYLWTPEQNTKEGLTKALLFKIASRCPGLLAKALPNLWTEVNDGKGNISAPSTAEVKYAFEVISSYKSLPPFCLFIDGLDEYIGDFQSLLYFINRLAINPRVKIVISSRPEPNCYAAFSELPSMKLEGLTKADIAAYVEEVIGENIHMEKLLRKHPNDSHEIMSGIVHKASGVFLWVVLACRSLICGLNDNDRIDELRRRVEELPKELKDLFAHMLERVNKRHSDQAARLLRLCFLNKKYQSKGLFESDRMYALEVAFLAEYLDTGRTPIRYIPEYERTEACKELDGRLRSRCGGLLELTLRDSTESTDSFCFCSTADWPNMELTAVSLDDELAHDPWADAAVGFMHRTVYDFLDTDEAWTFGCLQRATIQFEVGAVMSLGHLYLATQSQRLRCPEELHQVVTSLRDGIVWGVQADTTNLSKEENIFHGLTRFLDRLILSDDPVFEGWTSQFRQLSEAHSHECDNAFSHATLIIGIEAGAVNFVSGHPSLRAMASRQNRQCTCFPLLYHAIAPKTLLGINPSEMHVLDPIEDVRNSNAVVTLLLSQDCDPNESIPTNSDGKRETTPWIWWLLDQTAFLLSDQGKSLKDQEQLAILDAVEAFVNAGADLRSTKPQLRAFWSALTTRGNLRCKRNQLMALCQTQQATQERNWDRFCWT